MDYRFRISGAIVASLIINLALLTALPHLVRDNVAIARTEPEQRSIRLDFSPPPEPESEDRMQRLIDAGAEAEGPVADTDLISSRDSQAQDNSDAEGDPSQPAVDEIDDFDQMPAPPSQPSEAADASQPSEPVEPVEAVEAPQEPPAPQPEPEAAPEPQPETQPPAPEVVTPIETGTRIASAPAEMPAPETPSEETEQKELEEITPPEAPAQEQLPERFEVAAATPPAPKMPVQELQTSRGREQGGASNSGFTSFEANRHELGEYMLHVRQLVEREWRSALRMRYTGVSRTEAVIECSIRPDGSLEYARVVDPGVSLTYAVLCRQAIEQAAPFGPFPFDVPEIYRKENLEITWKFSYL